MFPTDYCAMGHCTYGGDLAAHGQVTRPPEKCGAAVYKESGMFSYWCDAPIQPFTPELEAAYRVGGEWAVQDLLGIMPNSIARRWI